MFQGFLFIYFQKLHINHKTKLSSPQGNTYHPFQSNEEFQQETGNPSRAICQMVFFIPNLELKHVGRQL